MPTPQILADIVRLLVQLLPAMALVCLVHAGIALRLEGGSTFSIGGSFTRWMLWAVILVTLPQLLLWFSFFGLPVPLSAGAIGTNWLLKISLRSLKTKIFLLACKPLTSNKSKNSLHKLAD